MSHKDSLHLPKTSFSLKAKLPETEPKILSKWDEMGLYGKMKALNKGRKPFVLHDGPPYANGNLHIGHALNKILKDATNRFQHALGRQIEYVPGWDCHGLPIEWKVETEYRKQKKDKDADLWAFRASCRDYAAGWIDIQRDQFKRFGVVGDWENPYKTMDYAFEATTVRQFLNIVEDDRLYRAERPVMWSPVEQTSLAEAEVEYKDIESTTAYVLFPVKKNSNEYVVIWTTTPWTLAANKAIAANPDLYYSKIFTGSKYLWMATDTVKRNMKNWGHIEYFEDEKIKGSELMKSVWSGLAGKRRSIYMADFVTADTGTGFVHIAPAHGDDDFKLGKKHKLDTRSMVGPNGVYDESVPLVGGQHVFKCGATILEHLEEIGLLYRTEKIVHSYPHSWRSKKPIIYRTTPQWFISLDEGLREDALDEIHNVNWVPASGRNRISSMIEGRGDWCVSRQRSWGVPLTMFVNKQTGNVLNDSAVNEDIVEMIEKNGCDIWFTDAPLQILTDNRYDPTKYEKITDVLDVWFDSGTTYAHVLDGVADLYLEGSDQHRGWFQSSLLVGVANEGKAPYKEVLTHGFVLDKNRRKMSKSDNNVVDPKDIIDEHGADVLRLWALSSDYTNDLTVGKEIMKRNADMYKRIRNTMRYLLSNLQDHQILSVSKANLPELERYMLASIADLDVRLRNYVEKYDYHSVVSELHDFCNSELSSFYFDIRKDSLYCDALNNPRRVGTMFVLDTLYRFLAAWFAPILPFTMEEVWAHRDYGVESVHFKRLLDVSSWKNDELIEKWTKLKALRDKVNAEIEKLRAANVVGSSLEVRVQLTVSQETMNLISSVPLSEIFITGEVSALYSRKKHGVVVKKQKGDKCERCWRIGATIDESHLCGRCFDIIEGKT